jgi:FKBP-type peptidyl-prolyl cis-trans isomerase SlyD
VKVAKDKVVSIDYTLTVQGEVVDTSTGSEPLVYLHGHGSIIPGLEKALTGLSQGDSINVRVEPEEGYGEYDEDGEEAHARSEFPEDVEVGSMFVGETEDGDEVMLTVVAVDDDTVTVDRNHPLAGEVLSFDVTVREVRDATSDELEHGHAHGPDGHHH